MSEHTAEPWELSAKPFPTTLLHPEGSWYALLSSTGALVALVNDWDDAPEEAKANRKLFLAAPKLLAALKKLLDCKHDWSDKLRAYCADCQDEALAAIREAKP